MIDTPLNRPLESGLTFAVRAREKAWSQRWRNCNERWTRTLRRLLSDALVGIIYLGGFAFILLEPRWDPNTKRALVCLWWMIGVSHHLGRIRTACQQHSNLGTFALWPVSPSAVIRHQLEGTAGKPPVDARFLLILAGCLTWNFSHVVSFTTAIHAVVAAATLRLLTESLALVGVLFRPLQITFNLVVAALMLMALVPRTTHAHQTAVQFVGRHSETICSLVPAGWVVHGWVPFPGSDAALAKSAWRLGCVLLALLPVVTVLRRAVVSRLAIHFERNAVRMFEDESGDLAESSVDDASPAPPPENPQLQRERVAKCVEQDEPYRRLESTGPPCLSAAHFSRNRWLWAWATPLQRSLWILIQPRHAEVNVRPWMISLTLAVGLLLVLAIRPWADQFLPLLTQAPPALALILCVPWAWERGFERLRLDQHATSLADSVPVRLRDLVALYLKHSLLQALILATSFFLYEWASALTLFPGRPLSDSGWNAGKWLLLLPVAHTMRAVQVCWRNIPLLQSFRLDRLWMALPVLGLLVTLTILVALSLVDSGRSSFLLVVATPGLSLVIVELLLRSHNHRCWEASAKD